MQGREVALILLNGANREFSASYSIDIRQESDDNCVNTGFFLQLQHSFIHIAKKPEAALELF
jgi:hypothetical protein